MQEHAVTVEVFDAALKMHSEAVLLEVRSSLKCVGISEGGMRVKTFIISQAGQILIKFDIPDTSANDG